MRWRISSVLVGIDYPRREMVLPAQGFCQKALSRYCVAMILFQDIVEILHRSMSTVLLQNTGGFDPGRTSHRPAKSRWSV